MELKLSVQSQDGIEDVLVAVDASATVGALAETLRAMRPGTLPGGAVTLAISRAGAWHSLPHDVVISESGLRSGLSVTIGPASSGSARRASMDVVANLVILTGPDEGREFGLQVGDSLIGRSTDCPIRLSDPLVSKRHAVVHVAGDVEILDLNSSNGVQIDGVTTARSVVSPGSVVMVGDTQFEIRLRPGGLSESGSTSVSFNRSPVLEPVYAGVDEELPEAPGKWARQPLPILSMLMPLVLGGILWLVTRNWLSVVFIALSPLLMVGSLIENAIFSRREFRRATAEFRAELAAAQARVTGELVIEHQARQAENPSAAECIAAAHHLTPLLWSRSLTHPRALQVRLGLATVPSRSHVELPMTRTGDQALRAEARQVADEFGAVPDVPVSADLNAIPALGIAGGGATRTDVVRGVLVQLLGLHAPGDLALAALVPGPAVADWAWLRWVPHTIHEGGPLGQQVLGADPQSCQSIVAALDQLIEDRRATRPGGGSVGGGSAGGGSTGGGSAGPNEAAVVVFVDDGAPIERGRLLALAARGHAVGVRLVWTAADQNQLPAACKHYLLLPNSGGPSGSASVGNVETGESVGNVVVEYVDAVTAEGFARTLAPVVDAAAVGDGQAELPRAASFLDQPGARDVIAMDEAVAERWRESGSLPETSPRRRAGTLRALVGSGAGAPFHLDLREQGPHALVGGTTGSGKSEFLQSWIMGMALAHSPRRVTFLLVDYKGGSAFSDCMRLPHTVGMVTDLTPRLVTRALTSLKAELRHREQILNRAGVPDLLALERAGDPETPPSLVIIVDEFAALVQEVPEFVDGVIDVAQRGRSLGLHLILATQRPAGVIKDNLRANTNLRVALRMADEEDSVDVIGSAQAAQFDPGIPGRAVAKTGPGRTTAFQALYVGGRTPDKAPPPPVGLTPLRFGPLVAWEAPEDDAASQPADGPTDIQRLVQAIGETASSLRLDEPRKPWLPELLPIIELADVPSHRRDDDLVLGFADVPEQQAQIVASYRPDTDGTMLVVGTGGSGKSTVLRTLALAAGAASLSGGVCQVYGIDFGSRGLSSLEPLPHVGAIISGDDHERIARLLAMLRSMVEERALRYSAVRASTIGDYRTLGQQPAEPRILLLIDNFGAFRQAYESGPQSQIFEALQSLSLDGRPVGVHLVIAADRPNAVPAALASSVQKRLVLKLSQDSDLAMAGLREDAFTADTPPGRGYLNGLETQVAVLGASPHSSVQGERIQRLAQVMRDHGAGEATRIKRLEDRVALSDLPVLVGDLPALGMADDTLAPVGFVAHGPLVLAGPPQSGRSTVLATLAMSLRRSRPLLPLIHIGQGQSLALSVADWVRTAATPEEVTELVEEWTARAAAGGPAGQFAVVIEGIPDYLGSRAESYLQDLVQACAAAGNPVIAEGDTSLMGSSWPLLQAVKAARHGIILQPDQTDGDALLRTQFPRTRRGEFPPGRGFYVRSGLIRKVQVAVPE